MHYHQQKEILSHPTLLHLYL
uniref:Uncharacterized protein n=1 Tax=Anguilla anguilla TaxID=7936 RepID=A0A0E9W2V2_ANGAN